VDEGVHEDRVRQVPQLQACIVEQARPPLRRGVLLAKATRQLGVTAGLLVKNGLHKVPHGFALMAMCPGQHILDIIVKTGPFSSPVECR
jgi:hypothetical protein